MTIMKTWNIHCSRTLLSLVSLIVLLVSPAVVLADAKTNQMKPDVVAPDMTAPAEPLAQCARLVNECFGDNQENETANCLFSSAKHPFCQGTSLGKITYQRWLMSPVRVAGIDDAAPSFLGPKLVDQECLEKFDTFFVSSLVKISELESMMSGMENKLKGCTKELSPELARP